MRLFIPKPAATISAIIFAVVTINQLFVSHTPPDNIPVISNDVSACRGCHQAIVDSFMSTAHYLDSRPADSQSIKGSFETNKNIYQYNHFMQVQMVEENGKFLQVGQVNGVETVAAYFNMVIGSGRNGQSYFTWSDNQLFQLPVSYYTPSNRWCNSPGFPSYFFFGRQVPANCLECHTSSVKVLSHEKKEYDQSSIVYGITCQRCHPGSTEHASYHLSHPNEKESKYVVSAANLNRQLRMDACALCHSGFRDAIKPPFSFVVGDTLEKYSRGTPVSQRADTLDVHGNQYGLLAASQCYIQSNTMDCSTCHDVHKNEFGNKKAFSEKCMSCHNNSNDTHMNCTVKAGKNIVLSDNCIDCHMPKLASKNIQLNVKTGQEMLPDFLHTHYISVYKDAAEKIIAISNANAKR